MIIPVENLPGYMPLVKDYVNDFDRVAEFFNGDFGKISDYKKQADNVLAKSWDNRESIVDILYSQNMAFHCSPKTLENIQKLKNPDSLAVVTGQQVGLFGGPLYTFYKALTTIKLAEHLSAKLNLNVLPIFYLVSEDHDFEEVRWTGIVNRANQFEKLVYNSESENQRTPVSNIKLNDTIYELIRQLDDMLPDTEFKESVFKTLGECYHSGESFHTAFARWFSYLFAEYGIILLDSSDDRLKKYMLPVFEKELNEDLTNKGLSVSDKKLEQKDYHRQISFINDRPNVFMLDRGRHSLQKSGDLFQNMFSGEKYTSEQLLAGLEKLSPKVALRPIVQDTLLPTVAYVAGPGEISYWAQLKPVYENFKMSMPVVMPRAGFTLVEPKVQRHLTKFNISVLEFITQPEKIIKEISSRLIPDNINEQLSSIKYNITNEYEQLGRSLSGIDPSMEQIIEKTRVNFIKQHDQLETKILRMFEQREKTVSDQLGSIQINLLPQHKLQERMVNILSFITKYNFDIFHKIYDAIDIEKPEHKILEL